MSVVDLQDCSCAASGCLRRSPFVFFSYAFRAATKMEWKLEEDDVDTGQVCDIVTAIWMNWSLMAGRWQRSLWKLTAGTS